MAKSWKRRNKEKKEEKVRDKKGKEKKNLV